MRTIKRYGSRKLYDTEESRYISLEEIAKLVRSGIDIEVLDNKTSENVTAQTLVQVISDEGRRGQSFLSTDLLHDLIRAGEEVVQRGVEQIQHLQQGVDALVHQSIDRLSPLAGLRAEMARLQKRLEEVEQSMTEESKVTKSSKRKPRASKSKSKS